MDPISGFCPNTKTFHSLRPKIELPNESENISTTSYVFSLLSNILKPNQNAFIHATTGATLDYPTLIGQVHRLAANLRADHHLSKGDIAFILAPDVLEVPVLYLALLSIGVVVAPSYHVTTIREVDRLIHIVNPSVAFVTSTTSHFIPENVGFDVIFLDSEFFIRTLLGGAINRVDSMLGNEVEVRQSDKAAIFFSSGTTGSNKAIVKTHGNIIAEVIWMCRVEARRELVSVQVVRPTLYHGLGFVVALNGLATGTTSILIGPADDIPKVIKTYKVTYMPVIPTLMEEMWRSTENVEDYLASLKLMSSAGAPLRVTTASHFASRFPWVTILKKYGCSEVGGISITLTEEESKNVKSVGKLNHGITAKIVDPKTNEILSIGQHGELFLKGPTVMKGYLNDIEATKSAFDSDGWLRMGDICYFDHEGYLYFVDRLKEFIKYRTIQIAPLELEEVLLSHPEITDAAVIPYPDEIAGEIPMAIIVRKQEFNNISESEVISFVAKQVVEYKKIRKVMFVESIPKSAFGKTLRRELRKLVISV